MLPFNRTAPTTTTPAGPSRNKYAGIAPDLPQAPVIPTGVYRVRVLSAGERPPVPGRDTWYVAELEVIDVAEGEAKNGQKVAVLFPTSGRGATSGASRIAAFVMAACGFHVTETAEFAAVPLRDDSQLAGRVVDVCVTLGKPIVNKQTNQPTGDYYRNFEWAPAEGRIEL